MKNAFSSLSEVASAFNETSSTTKDSNIINTSDKDLVYSTDSGRIRKQKPSSVITASDGFAKVRRETKGRKGKGVTTISGLGLTVSELKILASKLKKSCGAGGSVVGETIEVQGDKREMVKQLLEKQGFKVNFTGG